MLALENKKFRCECRFISLCALNEWYRDKLIPLKFMKKCMCHICIVKPVCRDFCGPRSEYLHDCARWRHKYRNNLEAWEVEAYIRGRC